MGCVSFPGAVSPGLSCCGPEPSSHPWEQQPFMALHGWLLRWLLPWRNVLLPSQLFPQSPPHPRASQIGREFPGF